MRTLVGESAVDFRLPDTDGTSRHLREFHETGPVVLIFLPSVYGWRPRWQFWSLLRHYDSFVQLGAELVVISTDSLPELRIYQIRKGLPFVFLSDRSGAIASQYELQLWRSETATVIVTSRGIIHYLHRTRFGRRSSARRLLRSLIRLDQHERLHIA